jgi:hypothetical protein
MGTNRLPSDIDRFLVEAMSSSLHGDASLDNRHHHPPYQPSTPEPHTPQSSTPRAPRPPVDWQVSNPYLSTLCDRLLKHHLPPRDYASPTERAILVEIIASGVLSNVIQKLSQGWMLTRIALTILGPSPSPPPSLPTAQLPTTPMKQTESSERPGPSPSPPPKSLSEIFSHGYHTIIVLVYQCASILLTISNFYTSISGKWKTACIHHSPVTLGQTGHETGLRDVTRPSIQLLIALLDVDSDSDTARYGTREMVTWIRMALGPLGLGHYTDK